MTSTLQASVIAIDELETRFQLQETTEINFFREWQDELPELTPWEKEALDRLKQGYLDVLKKPPILENYVRMAMLYPLLFIAGFYISPLQVKSEQPISLETETGTLIEGRLDILILKNRFWLLVIESKRPSIAIEEGIAQILAYMLANPHPHLPTFGMITNGGYFMFVKLVQQEISQYALSNTLVLRNQGNELYQVLRILKKLAQY
ncbi:MAG: restriction endonuclease subunit R [Symploca sp. SIO2G7]|nr:restriction endonuclease subunit R [Symploca sp. SIO2G7]